MSKLSCKWENNYFETSIIGIRRLQRQDKLDFKINFGFDKDQAKDSLGDGKSISDSNCLFYESIYDFLNIPKHISVNTYKLVQN